MYWKRISFKNSIGELIFDRKRLFCESIDCNGNAVISTAEQLMNCHGSVTISNYLAPKTIPCSFKLVDLDDDLDGLSSSIDSFDDLLGGDN